MGFAVLHISGEMGVGGGVDCRGGSSHPTLKEGGLTPLIFKALTQYKEASN